MPRPPFAMKSSRGAVLTCNGKFVVGGRASFAWETFLQRRAAGVPGNYAIRRGEKGAPWHRLEWTILEAEEALGKWGRFGYRRVSQMRRMRAARAKRGLPVA